MNSEATRFFATPTQLRMAHAIEQGDTLAIETLLREHAVAPNEYGLVPHEQKGDENPISFLTYAVMVRSKPAIEALLSGQADPNYRTPDGWSAMAEAARSPDDSLLPLLLSRGGDFNIKSTGGRPIAFVSYLSGHWPRTEMLLDRGADINATDSKEDTLLMVLANLNDYPRMLQLLHRGADPTITSGKNKVSVGWTVQDSAGRLTPEREHSRQQVIMALEAKGIRFPVPRPAVYRWDPEQKKFVLPAQ